MVLDFLTVVFSSDDARRRNSEAVLSRCKEGDLLKIYTGFGYSHWAVYVGDGKVIHRTEDNGTVRVKEDRFWNVVGNRFVKIKNRLEGFIMGKAALPSNEIVERARSKLGEVGYSTLFKNCEHFAHWCRYGVAISHQAIMAWSISAFLTVGGLATGNLPAAGLGAALGGLLGTTSMGSKLAFN
ncbi:HRASLS [Branchiostoma lanceolatum]|uniref:HRASLS protein n=1 Tax=Branchiostoma lanceolatum TaxID=7740 RepID=A0A8J9YYA4_BRALA|nr:HRASLS [Branchiostoma lanceolatum]